MINNSINGIRFTTTSFASNHHRLAPDNISLSPAEGLVSLCSVSKLFLLKRHHNLMRRCRSFLNITVHVDEELLTLVLNGLLISV